MRTLLIVALMGLLAGDAFCLSYSTAEQQIVETMTFCIEKYHDKYGMLPTKWDELDEFIARPLDELFNYALPTRRYAFVETFPLLPPMEGEIIAITRKPTYETTLTSGIFGIDVGLKGPGRYIIFRDSNGNIRAQWAKETYVVYAFAQTSQPLPMPDNEPETMSVRNARKEMWIRRAVYCLFIFLPLSISIVWWITKTPKKGTE